MNAVVVDAGLEDVYEHAANIGKDFEKLLEKHGTVLVTNLMAKVVRVLEIFEACIVSNHQLCSQNSDLRATVELLLTEKEEKLEYQKRFEEDLEQVEESWRIETRGLNEQVARLQEENTRLNITLREKENENLERYDSTKQDLITLERLQELVEKQTSQLKKKDSDILQKNKEIKGLQDQLIKLTLQNNDLKRSQKHLESKIQSLVEDRTEMKLQLDDLRQTLEQLHNHFSIAFEESPESPMSERSDDPGSSRGLSEPKLVVNLENFDNGKFTLEELRHIVVERDELRVKVQELKEELTFFVPNSEPQSETGTPLSLEIRNKPENNFKVGDSPPFQDSSWSERITKRFSDRKPRAVSKLWNWIHWDTPTDCLLLMPSSIVLPSTGVV
ncbi:RILP-like protein 1 [Tachypleus tridentatus]|uniref:RILP-like protein 1 n=1 Tax=Tachypleus tridentatus TaxID=6853 RepID=UPI003FD2CA88